jgi:hypothetical protein
MGLPAPTTALPSEESGGASKSDVDDPLNRFSDFKVN